MMKHIRSVCTQFLQKHLFLFRGVTLFFLITGTQRFFPDKTVFLLDYAPTPIFTRDWWIQGTKPLIRTLHNATLYLFGYIWGSKIYLSVIFFLSIHLGYLRGDRTTKTFFPPEDRTTRERMIALSMLLFVCNPFFSARYGTQPGIRLSCLLIGYGLLILITEVDGGNRKKHLLIGSARGGAIMSMPHATFMIGLLLGTYLVFHLFKKNVWIRTITVGAVVVLLNANRLLSTGGGTLQDIATSNDFSEENRRVFATYAHDGLGPIATVSLGYGFRGEKYGSAFIPATANKNRSVAGCLLLFFAGRGRMMVWQKNKVSALWIATVSVLCLILGVGIASDLLAPLNNFLYRNLPGYGGFREPQKRIGVYIVLILPLMVLGRGKSTISFARYLPKDRYTLTMIGVLIARTPGVINHLQGRYLMTDYPDTYQQTRQMLLAKDFLSPEQQWIHLPRHSYQQCNRTNKVISNTMEGFFQPLPMITADNIEIGDLYSNSSSLRTRDIELFLQIKQIELLQKWQVGGVLFTKQCGDFQQYQWLDTHPSLEKVIDNEDLSVYLIRE